MFAAYSQNVSGGLANPLNSQAFRDADNGGTFTSQKFLCSGKSTEPITNQFETQKVVHGSRDMSQQREQELEMELVSLKTKCLGLQQPAIAGELVAPQINKEKEIIQLSDKLSKLKEGHKRRENEFERKMEETVQQLTKLKNASIFANEKFTRKNTEVEDLKTKLKAAKEREIELERQNSHLKEEIKILSGRLAKFSVEDVELEAEDHFDLQPSEFDSIENQTIANGPFYPSSLRIADRNNEIAKTGECFDLQPSEFDSLTNLVIANGPFYRSSLRIAAKNDEITKSNYNSAPECMTPNGFVKGDDGVGKLQDNRDAVPVTKIDNSCPSHLKSASVYLNTRPLPAISLNESSPINQTSKVRCLNNRPVPTDESTMGTYSYGYTTPRMARIEKNHGFLGQTLNQWFGI